MPAHARIRPSDLPFSWDWCSGTNRFTLSPELREICGLAPVQREERLPSVLGLVHPEDRDRAMRLSKSAVDQVRPFSLELRIIRPDGEQRSLQLHAAVERGEGASTRVVGAARDITERRQTLLRSGSIR
jgi:PAS domain S-box-containing protein